MSIFAIDKPTLEEVTRQTCHKTGPLDKTGKTIQVRRADAFLFEVVDERVGFVLENPSAADNAVHPVPVSARLRVRKLAQVRVEGNRVYVVHNSVDLAKVVDVLFWWSKQRDAPG